VQPLLDAGGGLVCTFYFLLGVCNKDLAVSLMEIDGWSPLAPKKKNGSDNL
jgi:hypothetical protein